MFSDQFLALHIPEGCCDSLPPPISKSLNRKELNEYLACLPSSMYAVLLECWNKYLWIIKYLFALLYSAWTMVWGSKKNMELEAKRLDDCQLCECSLISLTFLALVPYLWHKESGSSPITCSFSFVWAKFCIKFYRWAVLQSLCPEINSMWEKNSKSLNAHKLRIFFLAMCNASEVPEEWMLQSHRPHHD